MCGKTDGSTLLGAIEQFPRCNVCTSFASSDYRKAVCSSGKVIVKKYSTSLCTGTSSTHATYSSNKCYTTDSNEWGSPTGLSFGLFDCGAPFPSASRATPSGAYLAAYAGAPPREAKSPSYQRKMRESVGA